MFCRNLSKSFFVIHNLSKLYPVDFTLNFYNNYDNVYKGYHGNIDIKYIEYPKDLIPWLNISSKLPKLSGELLFNNTKFEFSNLIIAGYRIEFPILEISFIFK